MKVEDLKIDFFKIIYVYLLEIPHVSKGECLSDWRWLVKDQEFLNLVDLQNNWEFLYNKFGMGIGIFPKVPQVGNHWFSLIYIFSEKMNWLRERWLTQSRSRESKWQIEKRMDLELVGVGFNSYLHQFLSVWLWISHLSP